MAPNSQFARAADADKAANEATTRAPRLIESARRSQSFERKSTCPYRQWFDMDCEITREAVLKAMRQALPLVGHAKPALLTFLRSRTANRNMAPRLTVTDVLDTQDARGPLCQFAIHDSAARKELFFAPISQIAFDRRLPLSRQINHHLRMLEREAKR